MSRAKSVHERLGRRITIIGMFGGLALLIFVGLDFDILFGQGFEILGVSGMLHEIVDHVVLPLLVLVYPTYLVTRWVIRSALEPFAIAGERIEAVDSHERGYRVDSSGLPLEAIPFVQSVNGLLERLDEAAARQQAFAGDVAHELRTPLSIARLELERSGAPDLARVGSELAAMSRLIEQLMMMAQLDAQAKPASPSPQARLDVVATDVAMRMAAVAAVQDRRVELEIVEAPSVVGQPDILSVALRNLIENALRVTPPQGAVTVLVGPGPRLRVRDQGPGIDPDQLASLCGRFHRRDRASADGAGLGLAIVVRVMEMYGGAIETDPDRKELHLRFPVVTPAPA